MCVCVCVCVCVCMRGERMFLGGEKLPVYVALQCVQHAAYTYLLAGRQGKRTASPLAHRGICQTLQTFDLPSPPLPCVDSL